MTDFLDAKLKEIRDRLDEIRPLVDEFKRLEAAERALTGLEAEGPTAPTAIRGTARRSPGRPAGTTTGPRRGRPRGGGTRAKQALELVRSRPGITIPELADAMQIKQNYLYRVMPTLAEQGLVHKSGRGWHVRPGAGEPQEPEGAGNDDFGGADGEQ